MNCLWNVSDGIKLINCLSAWRRCGFRGVLLHVRKGDYVLVYAEEISLSISSKRCPSIFLFSLPSQLLLQYITHCKRLIATPWQETCLQMSCFQEEIKTALCFSLHFLGPCGDNGRLSSAQGLWNFLNTWRSLQYFTLRFNTKIRQTDEDFKREI